MTRNRTVAAILVVAAIAAVAIFVAVYGMRGANGNRESASACGGENPLTERLAGLNQGEVAAFQIADEPKYVGGLTFADGEGEMTGMDTHRGQVVLLNLWATWCAPCREEMPALANLQQEMGSEDFQVLPVSMDAGEAEKPKKFYVDNGLESLPFRHDGTLATFNSLKKQGIAFGMPTTILVDRQGCAVGWMNGPAEWDSEDAKALVTAATSGDGSD